MKAIFAAFGSYGDVRPFLWMAKDWMQSGHEALLVANPFFRDRIEGEGVPFRPAGTEEDYRAAAAPAAATGSRIRDQGERIAASRRLFTRMFMNPARETYEAVSEARSGDTVVVAHFYAYGARLAAEKFSLPHANVCLSPYWLRGFMRPAGPAAMLRRAAAASATAFVDGQLFTKPFNALRAELGLGPMRQGSARWMFGENNLCLFPEWLPDFRLEAGMQAVFAGFPLEKGDSPLPLSVAEFLGQNEPPAVFTPGSAVTDAAAFFASAAEALERLGKPGIFLTGAAAAVPGNLPKTILHAGFVPLGALLPGCSAIVHHGGIGTAAQALAAGVPQLLCPRMDEQRENARVLGKLGVCRALPFASLSGASLAEALGGVLADGGIRGKCAEAAGREMGMAPGFLARYLPECGKKQAN